MKTLIKKIIYLSISIIILLNPVQVFAFNDFYSSNDIIFYDAKAHCNPITPNTSVIDTNENLEAILNYFTNKGLSLAAAAGIAGNFFWESGYYPNKIQNSSTLAPDDYIPVAGIGFGLAQWTTEGRQNQLIDFATYKNTYVTDFNMQLDYTWEELNQGYTHVLKDLNSIKSTSTFGSTSASMAAAIVFHGRTDKIASNPTQEINDVTYSNIGFNPGYESSGDDTTALIEHRGKTAESIYNTYNSIITDGTGVVGIGDQVAGSLTGDDGCYDTFADATKPENVKDHNKGWALIDGFDYTDIPCANGSIETDTYEHPTSKFTILKCSTDLGEVSSLISKRVVAMINAAAQDGITLTGSAWRSYERQRELRIRKIYIEETDEWIQNCPDIYDSPASSCIIPTATPGNSQHESGLAFDEGSISKIGSGLTFEWLVANAENYGFYNLASEGWHWSMSGS